MKSESYSNKAKEALASGSQMLNDLESTIQGSGSKNQPQPLEWEEQLNMDLRGQMLSERVLLAASSVSHQHASTPSTAELPQRPGTGQRKQPRIKIWHNTLYHDRSRQADTPKTNSALIRTDFSESQPRSNHHATPSSQHW